MEKAAVVILNYNGLSFLQQFMPSVTRHSRGYRVIVADNASTDLSLSFLENHYPEVEIIRLKENYGFARGYNEALQRVEATYLILLNSDVEVTHDWIAPLLRMMDEDPTIAACQPKIRAYHRKEYFEHAGAAGGFIDLLGYPFCRGRIFEEVEKDLGQYDDARQIFWASGACFFVRKEVFTALGGFDDSFHAHMEEIDLCWRINAAGWKVMYQPESLVYHVGGGTLPVSNPHKTYLNFRNSSAMLYKNTPLQSLWWKLSLKLILDLAAAARFLSAGKTQDAKAVIKAIFDFLKNRPVWSVKRRKNRFLYSKIRKTQVVYPGLMIIEYFVKRKKAFRDLNF
ncbi:MAG: glycosyltransferase family 2 protein [Cyclobacteriaceae bacterium]